MSKLVAIAVLAMFAGTAAYADNWHPTAQWGAHVLYQTGGGTTGGTAGGIGGTAGGTVGGTAGGAGGTVGGTVGGTASPSATPVGAGTTGATSVPEIDPAAAIAALTLLLGGVAVVRGRRRRA